MKLPWPLSLLFPEAAPIPAPTPLGKADKDTVKFVLGQFGKLNERQFQTATDISTRSGVVLGLVVTVAVALFSFGSMDVLQHVNAAIYSVSFFVASAICLAATMRAHDIEFGLEPLNVVAALDLPLLDSRYNVLLKGLSVWQENKAFLAKCVVAWYLGILLSLVGVTLFVATVIY